MRSADQEYFRLRAETEKALAEASACPEAACAHIKMAARYREMLDAAEPRSLLRNS